MIDYDKPKHLKVFFALVVLIMAPLGFYGIYTAWHAIMDGFIHAQGKYQSGYIYYSKAPKTYLAYVMFIGFGGLYFLWGSIYLIWNFKYLGRWKDRNNKDIFK